MPGTYVRPREIVKWLRCFANRGPITFVAIDDRQLLGEEGGHLLKNYFVHTKPMIGIDGPAVQKACEILNGACVDEAWWDKVNPQPAVRKGSPMGSRALYVKENLGQAVQNDISPSRPPFRENNTTPPKWQMQAGTGFGGRSQAAMSQASVRHRSPPHATSTSLPQLR